MKNEQTKNINTEGSDLEAQLFELKLKFKLAIAKNLIKGIDLDYYEIAWNESGRKAIKEYKQHIGWDRKQRVSFLDKKKLTAS